MYLVRVNIEVDTNSNLKEMSREEVLAFIKKNMGLYSDYDVAKLVEVVQVNELIKGD